MGKAILHLSADAIAALVMPVTGGRATLAAINEDASGRRTLALAVEGPGIPDTDDLTVVFSDGPLGLQPLRFSSNQAPRNSREGDGFPR